MGRNKKNSGEPFGEKLAKLTPELKLKRETRRSVVVVITLVLAGLSVLVLVGAAGSFGGFLLRVLRGSFGVMAYVVPLVLATVAWSLHRQDLSAEGGDDSFYTRSYVGAVVTFSALAGLIHLSSMGELTPFQLAEGGHGGGYLGALLTQAFHPLGPWGSGLILVGVLAVGVLVAFDVSFGSLFKSKEQKPGAPAVPTVKVNGGEAAGFTAGKFDAPKLERPKAPIEMRINVPKSGSEPKLDAVTVAERKDWKMPPFDLLELSSSEVDSGNIELNVETIKQTLAEFGIQAEMGEVNVGPTVTQYTLAPAAGVKLSQIAQLQGNLAMALAARSLRMELPIPGKSLVGLEVPNKTTRMVRLREVLQTEGFAKDQDHRLLYALGRDVAGEPMWADLAVMPHLLVAGASGKGKSVAMNGLLVSLLYRNTPQQLKLIVVDPKRVEMTPYNGIPHLLTPVITEPEKAVNALRWAVSEMEKRYKLLAEAGAKSLLDYNAAAPLPMPYIVILVDELADLMAVAKAEMEAAVVRLAQMARAVGIHLVLATQRPSVDVLTGLIKANITSRMAFAVASQTDSRTIIDSGGADKLLGNGDMLFLSAEFDKPKRIQGAYVSGTEIKRVVDFFKAQAGAVIYDDQVTEKPKVDLGVPGFDGGGSDDDPLLQEAIDTVMETQKASASFLQRRMRIGYARAARLLDLMEQRGLVGPADGAKPRDIYGGGVPASERAEYGIDSGTDGDGA